MTGSGGSAEPRRSSDVATAVVEAVGARSGRDPLELRPLFDAVDPTALERLVAAGDGDLTVSFRYEGYRVTVDGDGDVELTEADAG